MRKRKRQGGEERREKELKRNREKQKEKRRGGELEKMYFSVKAIRSLDVFCFRYPILQHFAIHERMRLEHYLTFLLKNPYTIENKNI